MNDYKAVRSSREISKRILNYLELVEPANYHPKDRAKSIRSINDAIQGRGDYSLRQLTDELALNIGRYYPAEFEDIQRQIKSLLHQKELLKLAYTKCSDTTSPLETHDFGGRCLKVIRQKDYDTCVENGIPPDFFRQSFFDHVTMYCVPDGADFCGSTLQDCEFSVCGIRNASFLAASIYSTDFHSSLICETNFHCATLAHSHFYDCDLLETSFNDAYLKSSNTIDCALSFVRYAHATLDGCSFGRVKAHKIFGFDTVKITQGGATEEECRANRAAILQALREGGVTDGI